MMSFIAKIDDDLEKILTRMVVDREQALLDLKSLAESGNKSAIVYLGCALAEDSDNLDAAVEWLLRANQFDSPDAAWNLAMIARQKGKSVDMRTWLDRAASLGEEDAKEICQNNYDVDRFLNRKR